MNSIVKYSQTASVCYYSDRPNFGALGLNLGRKQVAIWAGCVVIGFRFVVLCFVFNTLKTYSPYAAQAGLKLFNLLSLPPECQTHGLVPP